MKNKITVKPKISIEAHLPDEIMTRGRVNNDDQKWGEEGGGMELQLFNVCRL
jgi:hypothetical protein